MLPYAEPLAHEMMKGCRLVSLDVRNPVHLNDHGLLCTFYDVFANNGFELNGKIGELSVRTYFHGDAMDEEGRHVDPSPLRIKDVEYDGSVPGIGHVKLTAAEFPQWLYLSNRFPNKKARENFTPDAPLFRLDYIPIRFVTYEVDSPDRASQLSWQAEQESRIVVPSPVIYVPADTSSPESQA